MSLFSQADYDEIFQEFKNHLMNSPVHSWQNIYKLRMMFQGTSSVANTARSGRPVRNGGSYQRVAKGFVENPTESAKSVVKKLQLTRSLMERIVKKLRLKIYVPQSP